MCGRYEYHPTEFSDLRIRFNFDKEFKPCLTLPMADTYRAQFRIPIGRSSNPSYGQLGFQTVNENSGWVRQSVSILLSAPRVCWQ